MSNVVSLSHRKADEIKLKISISDRHRGQVRNVEWGWKQLRDRLSQSSRGEFTLAEFKALSPDEQLMKKNNGYFCGAQFDNGVRQAPFMREKYVLTLDIDDCSPAIEKALLAGTSGIGDIEYAVYSTMKHGPESSRLRVVIPMTGALATKKFEPLMRILASKLDPTMLTVDRVSFVLAQYMYWPAHCTDVEPLYYYNQSLAGDFIEPDAILEAFGDWQNTATLPKCAKEDDIRVHVEKAQDPRLKRGIVGAFCRKYNIHQAIAEFLSDVYEPAEYVDGVPSRYTYRLGTTAAGAIVYDDGNAMYSHHGTDPSAGRQINSYELVRIHLYGELDKDKPEHTPPQQMPSFQTFNRALLDPDMGDDEIRADYARQQVTEEDIDDSFEAEEETGSTDVTSQLAEEEAVEAEAETPAAETEEEDWTLTLARNEDGQIKSTLNNMLIILRCHKLFKGKLARDEFRHKDIVTKPMIFKRLHINLPSKTVSDPTGHLTKYHKVGIRVVMEAPQKDGGIGIKASARDIDDAISQITNENRVHPLRDYLKKLKWDGVPRLDQLWIKSCHTPDTPYFRQTSRMTILGAVARAFEPGCKFDFCPIIEGLQGLLKSSLIFALGGPRWTTEMSAHFDDKAKLVEATNGFWFVEIPELVQFNRSEVQQIKAAMSEVGATVRLAYEPGAAYYPRSFIFIGSTNDDKYLKDLTGNRRFWPIPCGPGQIDLAWIRANRDQLFAEAVAVYRQMRLDTPKGHLPLYLSDPAAAAEALKLQGDRMVSDGTDELAGMLRRFLDTPVTKSEAAIDYVPDNGDAFDDDNDPNTYRTVTCCLELAERVLGHTGKDVSNSLLQRIGRAMKEVDTWQKAKIKFNCGGKYGQQLGHRRIKLPVDPDFEL